MGQDVDGEGAICARPQSKRALVVSNVFPVVTQQRHTTEECLQIFFLAKKRQRSTEAKVIALQMPSAEAHSEWQM